MNRETILFSIIIPIYNEEKNLEDSLNAFIFEKYKDYEVILVNDGSTDLSLSICQKFANDYDIFKVVNQCNMGCVMARKNGVMACNGKYVVFADADDYVEKEYMSLLHQAVKKQADIYFLNNKINRPNTLKFVVEKNFLENGYVSQSQAVEWVIAGKAGAVWDKIYDAKLLKDCMKNLTGKLVYGDDVYINLSFLKDATQIYVFDVAPYLHVRDSSGSVCNSLDVGRLKEINQLYKLGRKILEEMNVELYIVDKFTCVEAANYAKAIAYMLENGVDKGSVEEEMNNSVLMQQIGDVKTANKSEKLYIAILQRRQLGMICLICIIRGWLYKLRKKAK